MSHGAWVGIHVLGAVVFLGNLIVTAVWKTIADRTGEVAIIAYAQRLVTITDIAFTSSGALLIAISGFILADDWGGVFGPTWLTLGFSGFLASALIWLAILIPTQARQSRLARTARSTGVLTPEYSKLALRWYVFGALATALPLATLFLTATKP